MNFTEYEIRKKYRYSNLSYIFDVYMECEYRANLTQEEYDGLLPGEFRFDYESWERRLGISKKQLVRAIKELTINNAVIVQTFKGRKGISSKYFLTRFEEQKIEQNKELKGKRKGTETSLENTRVKVCGGTEKGTQKEQNEEQKKVHSSQYNNLNIISNNIYSDLDNEDYVNKINEELEEELFNRIKSNYDPGAIKKELDSLKDKGLSKLDLLKELENNLKIKSMETKKEKSNDVENIFNYWNSKEIINHKKLTPVIEKAIDKALKIYSTEEIRQAIEIYSEILNSKFYFSYKWHISDFLSRKNGISTFMEDGSNRVNYEKWKKELDKNENTTRTAIRDRGVFNEGAKDIKIELPKREHRSYTDEELAELGII